MIGPKLRPFSRTGGSDTQRRAARAELKRLSDDVIRLYRRAAKERSIMHRSRASSLASRLLNEGELFGDVVQGYAARLIEDGMCPKPQTVVQGLSGFHLFDLLAFSGRFPHFRRYLIAVDSLRHLVLEFIERFAERPPSARPE